MRRRNLIAGLATTAALWPLEVSAQQKAKPVIGYLGTSSLDAAAASVAAFRQGLSDTGYVEGRNLTIEYRWAEGRYDRFPALAADLVDRRVDVIAAAGVAGIQAAKNATSTIPIVFSAGDPIGEGLVTSLARPGGNLTGVSLLVAELMPKRLELLSELVPQARVIALLVNQKNSNAEKVIGSAKEAARSKGVQLAVLKASNQSAIDAAFATLVQLHAEALAVGGDPFFDSRREQIVALAARFGVPAIYAWRFFAASGGLISYGPSLAVAVRQVGIYAGRILNGEKPADLPVEQPTKFELVINLKTAKALGLTVPQSLLQRADEVIE